MTSNLTGQFSDRTSGNTAFQDNTTKSENNTTKYVEGLIVVNNLHQIIGWNPASKSLTGYNRKHIIGSSVLDLLTSDTEKKAFLDDFDQLSNHCDNENICHESTVSIFTHSGQKKPVKFQWNRMVVVGVPLFSICIYSISDKSLSFEDFQEKELELIRKEKELAKLASSNRQLESFAYVTSHDLKEPLRSIGNFTQLLGKRLENKLDDTDREFFGFVTSGVKNMNSLIEDLLTYSRVNSGKHEVVTLNPKDSIAVVINSLHQRIVETNATIEIKEIPEAILGNPTKIKQLFQNLIANAIKFQNPEKSPMITIHGREEADCWTFTISDNGIGIKEEYYKKVFGIFTKLHHKSVYPGSGIGLSVCQRIVEQHDGEIWVDSVFEEGTNFHFSIGKDQCLQPTTKCPEGH